MAEKRITTGVALDNIAHGRPPLPDISPTVVQLEPWEWGRVYHFPPSEGSALVERKELSKKRVAYVARAAVCGYIDSCLKESLASNAKTAPGDTPVTPYALDGMVMKVRDVSNIIATLIEVAPTPEGNFLKQVLISLAPFHAEYGTTSEQKITLDIFNGSAGIVRTNTNTIVAFFPPLMRTVYDMYQQTHEGHVPSLREFQHGVMQALHIVMAWTKMTSRETNDFHDTLQLPVGNNLHNSRRLIRDDRLPGQVYHLSNFTSFGNDGIIIPKDVRDEILEIVRDLSQDLVQGEERRAFIVGCPAAESMPTPDVGTEDFLIANLMRYALFMSSPRQSGQGIHEDGKN